MKFCETFTKIALKHPKGILKPLLSFIKLLIDTANCVLCLLIHKKSLINLSRNSVRFKNSSGN